VKGRSGNAGGRPRKAIRDLGQEARKFSRLALATLVAICKTGQERNKLTAAQVILDRGFGKSVSQINALVAGRKLSEMTPEELRALEARLLSDPLADDADAMQTEMFANLTEH
jgi:hypothetical protein